MLCIFFFLIMIIIKYLLFYTRDLDNIKDSHHFWFTSKNLVEPYKTWA